MSLVDRFAMHNILPRQNTVIPTTQTIHMVQNITAVFIFIIIAVLLLISGTVMNPGPCSTSDESGRQSDISIESENTVVHDLNILISNTAFF
jgi:short subunit fatty acids transporter